MGQVIDVDQEKDWAQHRALGTRDVSGTEFDF